jgi:uncharacterized protein YcbK (DUF882 family)
MLASMLGVLLALPPARAQAPAPAPARQAAAAAAAKPVPAAKRPARRAPRWPTVVLYHINRHETFRLRVADDKGRPVRGVQRRVDRFLRCHHTNKQHRMDPRLTRLIYETGRRYPGRRIEVISGYRHPVAAKNPNSPHMKGLAADFRVQGVPNAELRDFLRRSFKSVGVGYYPNSSFVHLDVRKGGASAFWIDYSRPGERSLYAEDAEQDLRTGRADTWKPAVIDPSWAEEDGAPHSPAPAAAASPSPVPASLTAGARSQAAP